MSAIRAAVRKLARTVKPVAAPGVTFRNCWVDHVTAGASADGVTAVFLTNGTDVFPAPYLQSYNAAGATAGDMVSVRFTDGSPLIQGRVVGLPNLT